MKRFFSVVGAFIIATGMSCAMFIGVSYADTLDGSDEPEITDTDATENGIIELTYSGEEYYDQAEDVDFYQIIRAKVVIEGTEEEEGEEREVILSAENTQCILEPTEAEVTEDGYQAYALSCKVTDSNKTGELTQTIYIKTASADEGEDGPAPDDGNDDPEDEKGDDSGEGGDTKPDDNQGDNGNEGDGNGTGDGNDEGGDNPGDEGDQPGPTDPIQPGDSDDPNTPDNPGDEPGSNDTPGSDDNNSNDNPGDPDNSGDSGNNSGNNDDNPGNDTPGNNDNNDGGDHSDDNQDKPGPSTDEPGNSGDNQGDQNLSDENPGGSNDNQGSQDNQGDQGNQDTPTTPGATDVDKPSNPGSNDSDLPIMLPTTGGNNIFDKIPQPVLYSLIIGFVVASIVYYRTDQTVSRKQTH